MGNKLSNQSEYPTDKLKSRTYRADNLRWGCKCHFPRVPQKNKEAKGGMRVTGDSLRSSETSGLDKELFEGENRKYQHKNRFHGSNA